MVWLLVLLAPGNHVAVQPYPFVTEEACIVAGNRIVSRAHQYHFDTITFCVPTPKG